MIGYCGDTTGPEDVDPPLHRQDGRSARLRQHAHGDSMVVWTHEKLGSSDHVDMLGVATASGRGANLFRGWWTAIKDDVGKCRPLLAEDTCFATVKHFENSG